MEKEINRKRAEGKKPASPSQGQLSKGKIYATIVSGAAAALLVIVGAFVTPVGQRLVDKAFPSPAPPGPILKLIDTVVFDGQDRQSSPDQDQAEEQRMHPARIEIKTQNTGSARIVANRIRLTLRDHLKLTYCHTQGGSLEVSGNYPIVIPKGLDVDEVLTEPLNQQLGPDEANRFVLELGSEEAVETHATHFYRFEIAIETTGNPKELNIGQVVLALPVLGDNNDAAWFWDSTFESPKREDVKERLDWLGIEKESVTQCMKSNSTKLKAFLAAPATRSAELTALLAGLR